MLLSPDLSYRYLPGGATGKYGRRPQQAEIFDVGIYLKPLQRELRDYAPDLRLSAQPGPTTSAWAYMTKLHHRHLASGPKIWKLCDSPYELFTLFCTAGGIFALRTRERTSWCVVIAVIALQVIPSATLGGVRPRYSVPQQLLMKAIAALLLVTIVSRAYRWSGRFLIRRSLAPTDVALPGGA